MNAHAMTAYGLWPIVMLNAGLFILFAASFFKPRTAQDWRTLGGFSAFVVALFAEMYGFPLTIYLLGGWLGSRFQGADVASHDGGHLWFSLLGLRGDPHTHPVHLLSNALIVVGFALLASSWRVLHSAQQRDVLAVKGPYSFVRHPQYVAFLVVMAGFLLQWPTLATLLMFPVLAWAYIRLARKEDKRMKQEFGCCWEAYAYGRPAFVPRLSRIFQALPDLKDVVNRRIDRKALAAGAGSPPTHRRTQA